MGWEEMPIFGLAIPKTGIKDVPKEILRPEEAWVQSGKSAEDFQKTANNLAGLFQKNFEEFADRCSEGVIAAGPKQLCCAPCLICAWPCRVMSWPWLICFN